MKRKKTLTTVLAALSLGSLTLVGCKSAGGDKPADDGSAKPADKEGGESSCNGQGSCGGEGQ